MFLWGAGGLLFFSFLPGFVIRMHDAIRRGETATDKDVATPDFWMTSGMVGFVSYLIARKRRPQTSERERSG
jgi:hypothetical protein